MHFVGPRTSQWQSWEFWKANILHSQCVQQLVPRTLPFTLIWHLGTGAFSLHATAAQCSMALEISLGGIHNSRNVLFSQIFLACPRAGNTSAGSAPKPPGTPWLDEQCSSYYIDLTGRRRDSRHSWKIVDTITQTGLRGQG